MYIALGMVTFAETKVYNSIRLIGPDGDVLAVAPLNEEYLLAAEIEITQPGVGRKDRIAYSQALTAAR
jgi:hypothetical protein